MQPENKPKKSLEGFYRPPKKITKVLMENKVKPSAKHGSKPVLGQSKEHSLKPKEELLNENGTTSSINREKHIISRILIAIILLAGALVLTGYVWYMAQLRPVTTDTGKHIRVKIETGSSPSKIAATLKESGVIRSSFAFSIYIKITGNENKLKAGAYDLRPSLTTQKIVEHITEGKDDSFDVTFIPGETLANNRKTLLRLGYSESEIDLAFNAKYNRALFINKPVSADLEGFFYGETIRFAVDASVSNILNRFFDEFEAFIQKNNLVEKFKNQDLNLFEGITLASIVQKETSNPDTQRQVARVFFNRMKIGMNLGSDVTYQYAAKKMGVPPDPRLNSPYNTRIHTGLTPGPIATPGKSALLAVASPADNDYLFFLAGDDNLMHYAKTDEQHAQNVANYCKIKCLMP